MVRRGTRVGRASLVVHLLAGSADRATVGFVVTKAVGGAVVRNRVRRRLRHLVAARLTDLPTGTEVVVRALPAAASEPRRLGADFEAAWSRAVESLRSASGVRP